MAVRFVDYYRILGVDPGVDRRAIRTAYRRLARQYHPDVAKGKKAATRFILINEAYEVLSDPEKRRQHDRMVSARSLLRRASQAPSRARKESAVEPSTQRRGFRFVVDALGIRIDAGLSFGKGSRSAHSGSGHRRKNPRS